MTPAQIIPFPERIHMSLSWYAIQTGFRAEFKVEEALREYPFLRLGVEVYCPTLTKWHRERRVRRIVKWPLLPGYLFVGLLPDVHGDLPFPAVKAIDGVTDFVKSGEHPARFAFAPGRPNPREEERRLKAWWERKAVDVAGEMPAEPPGPPLSISEIRDMERAGAFDFTQDRIVAEKASRLARRSFGSFQELAKALAEASEEAA